MKNRINTSKFKLRTDLILDNQEKKGNIKKYENIIVNSVYQDGNYITITLSDITNYEDMCKSKNVLSKEIKHILKLNKIAPDDECLIIGLGNKKSTPDSLGPKVLEKILITRHLFMIGNPKEGIRCVSGFAPSVMGNTGIETYDIINSLIQFVKPKFVIVIDSLASLSIERINKTIQITDTGIHPGSGVGNDRKEISKKTLGIPVIAIGVPTVVSSMVITIDTLNYMFKHLSYMKQNINTSKLTYKKSSNYKERISNYELDNEDKNNLAGILGTLNDKEKYDLFKEVLDSVNENMIVTSTEIDFLIDKLAYLISSALNNSLHRQISHY